jgi:hypothetical protein
MNLFFLLTFSSLSNALAIENEKCSVSPDDDDSKCAKEFECSVSEGEIYGKCTTKTTGSANGSQKFAFVNETCSLNGKGDELPCGDALKCIVKEGQEKGICKVFVPQGKTQKLDEYCFVDVETCLTGLKCVHQKLSFSGFNFSWFEGYCKDEETPDFEPSPPKLNDWCDFEDKNNSAYYCGEKMKCVETKDPGDGTWFPWYGICRRVQ